MWVAAGCVVALTSACGGQPAAGSPARPRTSAPVPTTPPGPPHWPLTGLPRAARTPIGPAVSVKIDNVASARPQAGLNQADVVFEVLVEGGLSRFLAVFNSKPAPNIGPVRSVRPVDGALLRALHGGIFAYAGGVPAELAPAKAYSTAALLSTLTDEPPFHRDTSRAAPSNLFTSTEAINAEAARRRVKAGPAAELFGYGPLNTTARPATRAAIGIGSDANANWTWSGRSWLRAENGSAHRLADGSQVSADNVLMLRVKVTHSGIVDAAGNEDPFVLAYGADSAVLLRGGHQVTGHWSRPRVEAAYQFTDDRGAPLALTPGRTWVELVPPDGSITVR